MWFLKSISEIFNEINSSLKGLTQEQVIKQKEKYGSNILQKKENDSLIKIILNNLKEPLTLILIGVIVICFFIQEYKEVIIIALIVIINIIISTSQEIKSQKALDALEKMTSLKSTVIRNNKTIEIDSSDLVVGDIILLEAGNFIPADIRIIEYAKLNVDESALTGESLPVEKNDEVIEDEKTSLGDRFNMLYSSTFITNGRAKGIVVAVGNDTEIGKIATMLNETEKKMTPLQERLAKLSMYVSILAFIVAAIILLLNIFITKMDIIQSFINAITLAVAVIPESLPVIVSIILAISVSKMAEHNAIIKKLPAVESLGTVNIICTDKTGTLTLNKMSVTDYFIGDHELNDTPLNINSRLIQAMMLCNDSFTDVKGNAIGDPTELALTYFGNNYGIDEHEYRNEIPRVTEYPFDSNRKMMTTVHHIEDKYIAYTKGAIDQILNQTLFIEDELGRREITKEEKEIILNNSKKMSMQALRVLAFAYSISDNENDLAIEEGLTFIGAVGMIDPEKDSARVAIAKAKAAGIKTIMITGDHPTTAYAIARKLNLVDLKNDEVHEVITGKQLDAMSDEELTAKANNYAVYSRVSPEHKVRIVKALQAKGNIVSMTGDGVNDAPSLQTAHIGVSMGITGTDVAKQASSMILMDDDFSTIVYAVEEGRNIYNKIKRAVQFVLATNFAEVLAIFTAVILGLNIPLGAIHVLWVNLIVESLIAIPISMDVNDPKVMNEKPRPKSEGILNKLGIPIAVISLVGGLCVFGGYYLTTTLENNHQLATSVAFMIMATAPMLYVLAMRTPHKNIFISKPWENKALLTAILIGTLLNIALIYSPLNDFFSLYPLTGLALLITILGIIIPTIAYELYKLINRYR
ncbi:MAG: cation-translocating P-type ATPase [Bacilli bacterium]|jgi:Ca2+-transporting ATPase|nr:cation-translocating P-type ATPase [Bacilli bacterium]